jgi:hypothetical protein
MGNRIASWSLLALVAAVADSTLVRAEDGQHVPPDASLSIGEYEALGVPNPRTSWDVAEYIEGLRSLVAVERTKLPRVGSDRSGLLFERLVITHLSVPEIVVSQASADGKSAPGLSDLYSAAPRDGMLFDRELVAIRGAELRSMISDAPTQSEVEEAERVAAKLYESDAERRGHHAKQLVEYSQVLRQSSEAIRVRFGRLLYIGSLPNLGNDARADLVTVLTESVPASEGRLTAEDRRMLSAEMGALGRLESNSSIRDELMRLAALLSETQSSHNSAPRRTELNRPRLTRDSAK